MAITITKDNFAAEVEQAQGTVLLDFWASWCGPILDQLADERSDIKLGKINVDEQPELASRFDVMSIPTLVVYKNGQKVNEAVGLMPKEQVAALLD